MTEKREIICRQTGDRILYYKHSSGLDIYISEMEGFSTAQAFFAARYGSVNTCFKTSDENEFTKVPEGIAHYLEHKLFENEDCDAFEKYAKTGANANAYTSFDRTCYFFSCSDNFIESLKILLDFVQKPYFTKENVEKEQGIIGQEIKMMDDTPQWKVFFNLLGCLYHNHPVKTDIAGTVESIAKIDKDLLYKCYNTFYNLNNMVLAIAGNVNSDEIIKAADELLIPCQDKKLENSYFDEPETVVRNNISVSMAVGIPLFNIGFKCTPKSGEELVKADLTANTLIQIIADSSSPLYKNMTEKGYINSSFSFEVFAGNGYFSIIFEGESLYPEKVYEMIKREIKRIKEEGIDKKRFEEVKKCSYGTIIRNLNNVDSTANMLLTSGLEKIPAFLSVDVTAQMTADDVQEFLEKEIDPENSALSVVTPLQ